MDYILLTKVIQELAGVLTGGRLGRIYQDDAGNICLIITRARKSYALLLSPDRALPRMHLLSKKPGAAAVPSGFTLYLRSHLTGATVNAIAVVGEDRIAEALFSLRDREYRLFFELFGPSPNLILTESSGTILAVLRPLSPGDRVRRPLVVGLRYALPAKGPDRGQRRGADWPTIAAGGALSGEIPVNRSVERAHDLLVLKRQEERLRSELSASLNKSLARAERRAESVFQDLDNASHAHEYRTAGELILANLKSLKRGMEVAELEGYSGEKTVVRLDPRRTPAENARWYFRKFKKAKSGLAIITRRLEEARREASFLRERLDELASSDSLAALSALSAKLKRKGFFKRPDEPVKAARGSVTAAPYRRFEYAGWNILVGKNAAGNEEISSRLARPDDLWLHAEDLPGSHVLIRNPRRVEIPPGVLETAASLAAYYSKGRGADKVSVAYTQARYVKKPKSAKPGLVSLTRRQSTVASPKVPAGLDVS